MAQSQHINHFEGTKALTTKVGLTHNMKNLIWRHHNALDIDAFFPQSYDLSDLKGDEIKDFQEDFRYCQTIGFLKTAVDFNKATLAKNLDKVMIALSICERRIALNSDEIFTNKDLQTNTDYFKCISDDIQAALSDLKSPGNFSTQPWFRKLHNTYKDTVTEETAKQTIRDMLNRLKPILGNQYSIIGTKNAWILKPGGKSRGRGITIHSKFENIVSSIETSQLDTIWVVQKYIENPMIILNKKFDIRQWVVVTSWHPLRIWYFDECYLRFTADNYDPSKIHNKFMHLTNNCIASQSKNFNESSIEGNMWPGDMF